MKVLDAKTPLVKHSLISKHLIADSPFDTSLEIAGQKLTLHQAIGKYCDDQEKQALAEVCGPTLLDFEFHRAEKWATHYHYTYDQIKDASEAAKLGLIHHNTDFRETYADDLRQDPCEAVRSFMQLMTCKNHLSALTSLNPFKLHLNRVERHENA